MTVTEQHSSKRFLVRRRTPSAAGLLSVRLVVAAALALAAALFFLTPAARGQAADGSPERAGDAGARDAIQDATQDTPELPPIVAADVVITDVTTPDEGMLATLLEGLTGGRGDLSTADAIDRVLISLGERERTRLSEIEAASEKLAEHFAKAQSIRGDNPSEIGSRDVALSDALREAARLQELNADVMGKLPEREMRRLIAVAERAAAEAEARGSWLLANELYVRLNLLDEREQPYRADVERLNDRLGMVRLYAPVRFWELANERRVLGGEDELPPHNPIGDSFEEKLDPIEAQAVLRAIISGATRQVDAGDATLKEMLIAGLESLENMATTDDLYAAFDGLRDEAKRDRFLRQIRRRIEDLEQSRGVNLRDVQETLNGVLTANQASIRAMPQAILHEFGQGAMSPLDEYTAIIWPDEIKRFRRQTEGNFVGIGVQIEMDDLQNIRVVTPLEGTPAQRAGVRSGDLIVEVNGDPTLGFTLDQAVEVITGERGTEVVITVERGEGDEAQRVQIPIVRDEIDLPTVKGWEKVEAGDEPSAWDWFLDRDAGIGYIRLTNFSGNTTQQFDEAVEAMREQGLKGLVLDLRFNPGGLLDQAVNIASRFVPAGSLVVKTEDATGRVTDRQRATRVPDRKRLSDLPVVVLINTGSASASEIVSGAIQAYAAEAPGEEGTRAWLIGENTFGKGSVQNVFGLDRRGDSAMKVTTQYYKLEGDRKIHRVPGAESWGIAPDIEVAMLPEQVIEAVRIRRDADVLPLDENGLIIPDAERPSPSALLEPGVDLQLQVALALLRAETASPGIALVGKEPAAAVR